MRKLSLLTMCVLLVGVISPGVHAQEPIKRDAQAVYLVAQSVQAMGGMVPASSAASGWMEIEEGSLTDSGRVRVLTRGLTDSREEFQLSLGTRTRVYARGFAADVVDFAPKPTSLELAASSQSPCFPLVLLAAALQDPDVAFHYFGPATLEGVSVHHIRFWNTFASRPELSPLAEFTVKDVWIDGATGLPRWITYEQREAGGASSRIKLGASYSDYRNVGGVLYPFLIERIFNGTPWATIRIDNVVLGTSLSDSEFAVR